MCEITQINDKTYFNESFCKIVRYLVNKIESKTWIQKYKNVFQNWKLMLIVRFIEHLPYRK